MKINKRLEKLERAVKIKNEKIEIIHIIVAPDDTSLNPTGRNAIGELLLVSSDELSKIRKVDQLHHNRTTF